MRMLFLRQTSRMLMLSSAWMSWPSIVNVVFVIASPPLSAHGRYHRRYRIRWAT